MNIINFHKMHGCGNDFVIIDNRIYNLEFKQEFIKFISDRNKGIGCDQVIIIENSDDTDIRMKIYNNDGSEAGNCGNAIRCVTKLIAAPGDIIRIKILSDVFIANYNKAITVNMGKPKLKWQEIPLLKEMDSSNVKISNEFDSGFCLNIGNPHIVFVINNFDTLDIPEIGRFVENNALFPEKINVNFANIISKDLVRIKTWERGAGHTLACGSGACASFYALHFKGLINNKATITQAGGDLIININESNEIIMSGDAEYVYKGSIEYI